MRISSYTGTLNVADAPSMGHSGPEAFGSTYIACSLSENTGHEDDDAVGTPMLAGGESYEWAAIPNLDIFFTRLYR